MDEREIFEKSLDFTSAGERAAYLAGVCGDDAELRARIDALLRSHENAGNFMHNAPVAGMQPTVAQSISERPGSQIGPYKLLQQIGEGGMGLVYMAEQTSPLKRKVALKVIKPGMDTKEVVGRFEAERQALALMDHPNIAKVLDAGETQTGRPFFVMELVNGIKITEYCDEQRLDLRNRLSLFQDVCMAVQHAHQKGIIHRDIKPSNVLVTEHDGTPVPKVIDFGVAKALLQKLTEKTLFTRFQQFVGTPIYMSPEQASLSGLDIDTRSDIYSLGVLLYELLTDTTPFDETRFHRAAIDEIRRILREEEPPKPSTCLSTRGSAKTRFSGFRSDTVEELRKSLVGDLDWIVMKALEKERNRRYFTAKGLADDIARHLNNEAVVARPPSKLYRFERFAKRHKSLVVSVALTSFLVLSATVFSFVMWRNQARATQNVKVANTALAKEKTKVTKQRDRAEENLKRSEYEARRADVLRRAAEARSMTGISPQQAVLKTCFAAEQSQDFDIAVQNYALSAVLESMTYLQGIRLLGSIGRESRYVCISKDSNWLFSDHGNAWRLDQASTSTVPVSLTESKASVVVATAESLLAVIDDMQATSQRWLRLYEFSSSAIDPAPVCELPIKTHPFPRLCFSPSSRWLALCEGDSNLQLLDVDDGLKPKWERETVSTSAIEDIAFSPDGNWLAAVTNREIAVWKLGENGEVEKRISLGSLGGYTWNMSFSPNSRWLTVSVNTKGSVVWDLDQVELNGSGTLLGDFGVAGSASCFSQDSQRIFTSGRDYAIYEWNLASLEAPSRAFTGHSSNVKCLDVSPDGRWLASGAHDKKAIVWDLEQAFPSQGARVFPGFRDAVTDVDFSSDGRWLACGGMSDPTPRVWPVTAIEHFYSPVLFSGSGIADHQRVGSRFVGDGNSLITEEGSSLRVLNFSGTQKDVMEVPNVNEFPIDCFGVSENGKWLALNNGTGNIDIFMCGSLRTLTPRITLKCKSNCTSIAISNEGDSVLASFGDGKLTHWKRNESKQEYDAIVLTQAGQTASMLAISPDKRWLMACFDNEYRLWSADAKAGTVVSWKILKPQMGDFTFSPRGRWLLTRSKTDWLWDLSLSNPSLTPINLEASPNGHADWAAEFSPDEEFLVVAKWTGAFVWRLDNIEQGPTVTKLDGHTAAVHGVSISSDSRYVATASQDQSVRVWDMYEEDPSANSLLLKGHTSEVRDVDFHPTENRLMSATADKIRIWDLDLDKAVSRARALIGTEIPPAEIGQFLSP